MSLMRFHILHETQYRYEAPVALSQQLLHLTPRNFQFQQCESHHIAIDPPPVEKIRSVDYFGNSRKYVAIVAQHEKFVVRAESVVCLTPRPTFELIPSSTDWETVRDSLIQFGTQLKPEQLEPLKFLYPSPHVSVGDELAAYAKQSFVPGCSVLAGALDLTNRIFADFTFDPEATDISTPLDELLKLRRGVCQDFAHLMIGCLRSLGLPCRYVSGYILTHPAPGKPRLIGADASHAWVSVYCPSVGWVDFDPTNRCMVNLEHITLGWGRDFSDVTLLRGVMLGSGGQDLTVSVTVTPLSELAHT